MCFGVGEVQGVWLRRCWGVDLGLKISQGFPKNKVLESNPGFIEYHITIDNHLLSSWIK